ncbi:ribonuclease BN [Desulfurispirillum indicum S5]|uniref:Ribonuclease BN n=1 Tax=Desulfurispirillum indicum (strain ATCC BAA-1389 / DSM 22839 / S5) TaxID=653733 RepID=E6W6L0_DESIS|nr:YihY family inner membrane protein [Desulfurispirillum indicum]ADU65010.1 ribonuclease BN [Desulfurispirillum indicum S5]
MGTLKASRPNTWLKGLRRNLRQAFGFFDAELGYSAASLSFYTIFAFIPLLLIALSVTTRLPGFSDQLADLREFLMGYLLPTNVDAAAHFFESFLGDISRLGIMGALYVIATSILFFKNYQHIASRIFRSETRSFWESLTTYWTLMTLMPIGLALSLYFTTTAQVTLARNPFLQGLDLAIVAPYAIAWAAFIIVFRISANKPIQLKNAAISALVTSLAWNITKELFVAYAVINKAYTTIYGSFSILLLLLLWVYVSWVIVLYGMRLCEGLNSLLGQGEGEE